METETKLTSKELVKQLTDEYYDNLLKAKENGKKVAWASSIIPQEFLEAMDIEVAYPENHAALIAARGGADEFLEKAEQLGYANDICSYARVNLGYANVMDSSIQDLPKPDFVISTNNICNTVIKWYENLAKIFDVPFILIDAPYNVYEETSENAIQYIKGQFEYLIEQLEIICGKPFDYERFEEVMKISVQSVRSWIKSMDYSQYVPSPLDGFNMFNYMALIVCIRGRKESIQLFDLISEEMEEMIKSGASQFKGNQKYRYMFEGIAVWPYLSHNYKTMKQHEAILVGSTYPKTWNMDYEFYDIDSMAEAYSQIPPNCSIEKQIDIRTGIMNQMKCDGAVYHMNRSCKLLDFMQYQLRTGVYNNVPKPFVVFDGDQADPKNFAKAQYETRVQALMENMENALEKGGE